MLRRGPQQDGIDECTMSLKHKSTFGIFYSDVENDATVSISVSFSHFTLLCPFNSNLT